MNATVDRVEPCPSPSARRRHAAHGRTCGVCDTAPAVDPADEVARLRLRVAELELRAADTAELAAQRREVGDVAAIKAENRELRAQLGDVRRAFCAMSMSKQVDRALVQRWRRRLFNPADEPTREVVSA